MNHTRGSPSQPTVLHRSNLLFYSVLAGWTAYLTVGVAVALRVNAAYPVSIVLGVLTLAVSLPQPEHYMFGASIATLTFVVGSLLQIGVILSVTRYLLLKRRRSRQFVRSEVQLGVPNFPI